MAGPKRPNRHTRDLVVFEHVNASLTATETVKLFKCDRAFKLRKLEYVNPTGLATDAANYYVITLIDTSDSNRVLATWSTETGQEGAIAANTFVEATLSTVAEALNSAKGAVLAVKFTEAGTQTLPAGRLVVHGDYV